MQQYITTEVLNRTMNFDEYMALTKSIVESNEPTGIYQNPKTHRYTRSNLERMEKVLDKMVLNQKLYNLLSELSEEWVWLVISEPWCGDASWGTPALYIMASASDKIDFRILLRDQNPEIMQHYQTAGTDSIPKLICLKKEGLVELGTWGPRPQTLHQMVLQFKNNPAFDYRESVRMLHAWFEEDMTRSTQEEMIDLIKDWKNK